MNRLALPLLVWLALPGLLAAQAPPATSTAPGRLIGTSANGEARTAFETGLDRFQHWSWAEAARYFERARSMDPGFALASAFHAQFLTDEAQRIALDQAVAEAAGASPAELAFAAALREVAAGRMPAARALFRAAAELAPDDPRIALEHARSLPPRERLEALRALTQRHPDFVPAHMWLAYWLTPSAFEPIGPEDSESALRAAQEAVRLAPTEPGAHTALGHVLHRLGRKDEALSHLRRATSGSPSPEYAHRLLAEIALQDRRFADVRGALQGAIDDASSPASRIVARRLHALSYLYERNLDAAVRELEAIALEAEASGLRAEAGLTHNILAVVLAGAGRADSALRRVEEAKRLAVNSSPTGDWDIIAYSLAGRGDRARQAYESYLERNRNAAGPVVEQTRHRLLGWVLLAEGRPAEALEHLRQGGSNPWSQLGLIEAYERLGQRRDARAERDAMLARRDFALGSTAMPIAIYRARTRR